ncbi:MAG: hypothetical protein LKF31_07725 [Muribaculaceae bacterium]|jgi:hypothetical protein|nr:hypothetical protein [Muribaculaceae bacterium]
MLKRLSLCAVLLLLSVLSASADVAINETNFPDSAFRSWITANIPNSGGVIAKATIDTVTTINCSSKGVADLNGIGFFTALKKLDCSINKLTALDMSGNVGLTDLDCYRNNIKSLNVRVNPLLTHLYCYRNPLDSLDVSRNIALIELVCSSCGLTSLNLRADTALIYLSCSRNNLKTLDLSANIKLMDLECNENYGLQSLDLSANVALVSLDCNYMKLSTLDLKNNTELSSLSCSGNNLTSLDLSANVKLKSLSCASNQLKKLDTSKNTLLKSLYCSNNNIIAFDFSNNDDLNYFLCNDDSLTVNVPAVGRKYDLTQLASCGFNAAKASNWTGGSVDGTTLTFTNNVVSYDYDCGKNMSANIKLVGNFVTSVDGIENVGLRVVASGGSINILGADGVVQVYGAEGRLVYAGTNRTISVPAGLYIVKTGGRTFKVLVM